MRDDFTLATKEQLAKRVGYRCSNPECRSLTVGPRSDVERAVNIGVAAHITAASPGGPRYDPAASPTDRSSRGNGILLCANCAKLIDDDPAQYTRELLGYWKYTAEQQASNDLGRPTPRSIDDPPRTTSNLDNLIRAIAAIEQAGLALMKRLYAINRLPPEDRHAAFDYPEVAELQRGWSEAYFGLRQEMLVAGEPELRELLSWFTNFISFQAFLQQPGVQNVGDNAKLAINDEIEFVARLGARTTKTTDAVRALANVGGRGGAQLPWLKRPGGPKFRLSPGVHDGQLLCTFYIRGASEPGDVKARWTGAGTNVDWRDPMPQNVPAGRSEWGYQMKPVEMTPQPPADMVTFEVKFWLDDGEHGARWLWPLEQHEKGH